MPRTLRVVELEAGERDQLNSLINQHQLCPTLVERCRILLAADGQKDLTRPQLASLAGASTSTVTNVLNKYRDGGLEAVTTLNRKEASDVSRLKVDGRTEAIIIATACSPPPQGYCRWTLRLLASRIELSYDIHLSKDTIRNTLKANELQPHHNKYWCIPPKENAEFVACMEDVLCVYERPYDPDRPMVCLDETSLQLQGDTRDPMPMIPGSPPIKDYEYERRGTCSIFMVNEPLAGQRRVFVNRTRTAVDFAYVIQHICDEMYPDVKKIVLVMDNLNTHDVASLYKAFPPAEARRLRDRLEIHYTPKHGSWLDMAEIELNVLTRQCLKGRRIPDVETLAFEIAAWEKDRNAMQCKISWQFTTADARIKLKSLYPKLIPYEAPTPVPVFSFCNVADPDRYAKWEEPEQQKPEAGTA